MIATGWGDRSGSEPIVLGLLGATFAVVALLIVQSLTAAVAHDRVVAATLADFADFASGRVADELDSELTSIFLDQIAASRSAHYAWLAGGVEDSLPMGQWSLPEGAVPTHFSIVEGQLIVRGAAPTASEAASIVQRVGAHAREIYPRPAPYAVLRSADPTEPTVVYRKEEAYERVSVYGFVVRFERLGPLYARLLEEVPVLPRSLSDRAAREQVVTVRLVFPQWKTPLHTTEGPASRRAVASESVAAKAGRMAVRVELDEALARELTPGAFAAPRLSHLIGLAALTFSLLAVALVLLRRASRLREMREAFVANASHDLRTPLAQIRMFSETLLLERLPEPGEQRRSLEIIQQQAEHLGDLVDNIVQASGRDGPAVQRSDVDLEALLTDTADGLRPAATLRESRIRTEVTGEGVARVDAAVLRRILVNLVDNALKYGPREQTVTVRLASGGNQMDVVVEDEGPGIPRAERQRVWERFTRLGRAGGTVTGSGLGLAVVRDPAHRHGGDVRIEETAAGGTRVIASLMA